MNPRGTGCSELRLHHHTLVWTQSETPSQNKRTKKTHKKSTTNKQTKNFKWFKSIQREGRSPSRHVQCPIRSPPKALRDQSLYVSLEVHTQANKSGYLYVCTHLRRHVLLLTHCLVPCSLHLIMHLGVYSIALGEI